MVLAVNGCDQPAEVNHDPAHTNTTKTDSQPPLKLWQAAEQILRDTLEVTRQLNNAIDQLLADPSDTTLAASRTAWQQAHNQFSVMLPFMRMSELHPQLLPGIYELRHQIDAWPIMPGYIDSVEAYPHSGIVNDIALPLTAESLRGQHALTDNSEVSLGFHALAFILWGEHGARSATDFIFQQSSPAGSELSITELPNNRRRTYLKLASNLLTDDLARLHQLWQKQEVALQQLEPGEQWVLVEEGLASAITTWKQQAEHCIGEDDPSQDMAEEESGNTSPVAAIACHNRFAGAQAQWLETVLRRTQTVLNSLDSTHMQPSRLLNAWQPVEAQLNFETDANAVDFAKLAPALQEAQAQLSNPPTDPANSASNQ